jgi:transposase
MAAAGPLDHSGDGKPATTEPVVPGQPPDVESLPAQGSLGQLWNYVYEGAMLNYLQKWIDPLRWQRLEPFQKLGQMLLEHLDGILNYCRIKVPMGVVEAVNGNIKALIRRGRGYKDLDYLLLKARYMAATKSEFVVLEKAA